MPKRAAFELTPALVAANCGSSGVVCLDTARSFGRTFALYAERPDAAANRPLRADVITPTGGVLDVTPAGAPVAAVTRVDIRGPLEQRAGYHAECGGWSDGHDAIAERMVAAFADGDVVMVVDSPGGAHAGLQEAIRRVQEAKASFSRRVIAYADEMIGSAAYWWVATVADEIYLPEAAVIGSIGARSAHCSVAGAMAKEGVETTYFAWPGPGKVAFAPELPLSDVGKERGERDVSLAGEAFAAAVAAARGLSRDDIVALDADALTGQAAVDAGLADGVASIEDVMSWALTGASGDTAMADEQNEMNEEAAAPVAAETEASESYEKVTRERYESDDEPEADDESDDDDDDDDDGPPSSKRPAPPAPPAKKSAAPPPAQKGTAAKVDRLVASNASKPALKAAVHTYVDFADRVMALTSTSSLGAAMGALLANAEDAAAAGDLRTKLDDERRVNRERKRMELGRKLAAAGLPGYARGDLFIDKVDDATGKRTMVLAPQFAEMRLSTFEALVESKLKNRGRTPSRKATPFEPDREAAKTAHRDVVVAAASQNEVVIQSSQRSSASIELHAAAYAALFPNETGVSQ